jgi:DNA invertase Pin-like site-specific DNA recombinase
MKSKIAQKSDKQLWGYDTMKTPYELAVKMYEDYKQNNLSMKEVGKKYGITANGVNKAFTSWDFKTRTPREGQLKNFDEKQNDIKNGISVEEFCSKYNSTRSTYYRYKRNLKKDLVD